MDGCTFTMLAFLIMQIVIIVLLLAFWYGCVDVQSIDGIFGGAFIPIIICIFSFIPLMGLTLQGIVISIITAEIFSGGLELKRNKLTKFLFNVK